MDEEVRQHAAIVRVHARPVGIEDARNLDVEPVPAVASPSLPLVEWMLFTMIWSESSMATARAGPSRATSRPWRLAARQAGGWNAGSLAQKAPDELIPEATLIVKRLGISPIKK